MGGAQTVGRVDSRDMDTGWTALGTALRMGAGGAGERTVGEGTSVRASAPTLHRCNEGHIHWAQVELARRDGSRCRMVGVGLSTLSLTRQRGRRR